VFVDGDFWHGWRFPQWKDKLQPYWLKKIERNRRRDRYNFQRLRRDGWMVLRFWSHQVERDLDAVVVPIEAALTTLRGERQAGCDGIECSDNLRGCG
jgi:DNA mismatch endonuclease (patch repair protein)